MSKANAPMWLWLIGFDTIVIFFCVNPKPNQDVNATWIPTQNKANKQLCNKQAAVRNIKVSVAVLRQQRHENIPTILQWLQWQMKKYVEGRKVKGCFCERKGVRMGEWMVERWGGSKLEEVRHNRGGGGQPVLVEVVETSCAPSQSFLC